MMDKEWEGEWGGVVDGQILFSLALLHLRKDNIYTVT